MVCWAHGLTRAGLLGAMRERRCYWAFRGAPEVKFSLEGRVMGSALRAEDIATQGGISAALDARYVGKEYVFDSFELIHNGELAMPRQDCEGYYDCTWSGVVATPDPRGHWYVRLLLGENPVVATSAIWID